jgi:hypothetical protein
MVPSQSHSRRDMMAAIPKVFDQPGALFVLISAGRKFPPVHGEWQLPENGHSYAKACRHRGNVGVLAGGAFGGLDQDLPEAFQGLGLGATTSWETRPGRAGHWLRWADNPTEVLPKFKFKMDAAQIYLFKEGVPVGEIKLQRAYQVIPPSWKTLEDGTRAEYKFLDSSPPAEISLEGLLQELQQIGITFSEKEKPRLEENVARLEEKKQTHQQKKIDVAAKARQFLVDALTTAGGKEGNRNKTGFWLACQLRDLGLDPGKASEILLEYMAALEKTRKSSQAPYTREEALHNVEMAYKREAREPPKTQKSEGGEPSDRLGDQEMGGKGVEEEVLEISEEELKDLPKSFNPRLDLHLEPGNFISKYMSYAKTTSDAYEEYHFASGLVLLSVAADRQIVISMRHGDIYPNIWIFPIGDSTVSRKTTAHRLCKLILKTKFPKKSLPSSFSPEALMDAISSTPRCFYLKDEAGSLLASLCKDYMAETRDFLAEIYECDDYYRKLKKYECIITDPYITQYLMTTPDNLKEYTTTLDLTSGWLLRYLWMYPNYPKEWRAFAEKDGSDFEKYTTIYGEYNLVVEKLATPRRLSMTAESMLFFQEWQRGIEEAAMENADNITKALAGRLMTHAVKMAALFTIGREDFDENSKIELPHIQEAARLVVEYFLPIGRIIIEEVARAESKNVQDKIIGTIKRWNGLISQRDLLRALHLPLKDVDLAIGALVMAEEIERVSIQSKKGSKLCYALIKSETKECHSDIVSHNEVYKGKSKEKNNKEPNTGLYTPHLDTTPHRQMGQDRIQDVGEEKTGIEPHPRRDMPIPEQNVEKEEFRALLRFLTDYRTEWPRGNGEYESISYLAGAECAAPLARAIRWQARGVAKILDIDYLLGEATACR